VTIYIVRHAKAGSRREWPGDDDLRPLSPAGHMQAESIASALLDRSVTRIVSSPYVRCRQTVDPLGQQLRLPVELSDALAEGATVTDTMRLIEKMMDETAVLCTHGDVVGNVLDHLEHLGVALPHHRLEKGSSWVFDTRDGEISGATYLPPRE
jgi:broad specificity phosphatase PhoE